MIPVCQKCGRTKKYRFRRKFQYLEAWASCVIFLPLTIALLIFAGELYCETCEP